MRRVFPLDRSMQIGGFSRAILVSSAALLLLVAGQRPVAAQASPASGIFEIERPLSFTGQAAGPSELAVPTTDLSLYLARYHLVTKTLTGTAAGALTGAAIVFLSCSSSENDENESDEFLDTGGCLNRDRWFGFVAGGSLLGTVIGGARGASLTGKTFGMVSPLQRSDCSFREGLRRAFIGSLAGSVPAVVYFASGGNALEASLVTPLLQTGGAIIATWGCIGEPRLGPIGTPPMR